MLFTWFLGEPVIKALKTWNTLGERFLKENRIGILHDCGFDTGRLPMERIRVKSPDLSSVCTTRRMRRPLSWDTRMQLQQSG